MRTLGRVGIEVSPVGFGCWAIGGPFSNPAGEPLGWGEVDDDESVRAIRRAVELGVTFFDTADVYGAGHSERVLGKALAGIRDQVVIATKWGNTFDESTRVMHHQDDSVEYVHKAVRASLDRLGTDYLDLYQLHFDTTDEIALPLREACEDLVREGLIRSYAWSTDTLHSAELFAAGEHCSAVQHEASVLHDASDFFALCERADLASVNRTPLGMGILGRRTADRPATGADIRTLPPSWLRFFDEEAYRHRGGGTRCRRSATYWRATGGRWRRARWPGCGRGARGRCRSRASARSRRRRRTPARCSSARSAMTR